MKQYYIYFQNSYYNKKFGFVDHKNFADKLSHVEATALKKYYPLAIIKT